MFNARTIGTQVRIRTKASTSSEIVCTIRDKGTSIDITPDTVNLDWFIVKYGEYSGYISAQYVEVLEGYECSVSITSGALNIRQTPSVNAKVLYTKKKNDSMVCLGSHNGWKCVSCSQGTGWASGEYIFVPA